MPASEDGQVFHDGRWNRFMLALRVHFLDNSVQAMIERAPGTGILAERETTGFAPNSAEQKP